MRRYAHLDFPVVGTIVPGRTHNDNVDAGAYQ